MFVPWRDDPARAADLFRDETCTRTRGEKGEKTHQGVSGKKSAPYQGITWSKSTIALGLRGEGLENRVGSRSTGKKRDTETGLDYFGARYYSNGLGRWVSADWSATPVPVPYADFGDPQSLNLYGFVGGNPASKADPDGHYGEVSAVFKAVGVVLAEMVTPNPLAVEGAKAIGNFLQSATTPPQQTIGLVPNCTCQQAVPMQPVDDNKNNNSNQQSSVEQGRDAQGRFTSKQPGQSAPGAAAEKEGLDSVGAVKNTEKLNGTVRDGTIPETGQHVEVKSGASVSNTGQLRSMGQTAVKETGQPLKVVITNPNATVTNKAQQNPNLDIKPLKKE